MKSIIITAVFIASTFAIFAQEIEIDKDDFSDKEVFKQVKELVKQGNAEYEQGKGRYRYALTHYYKAYKKYNKNAALNYRLGDCYLYSLDKAKCTKYFAEAYKINPNIADDVLKKLGRGYQYAYEFDVAIENFKKYKNSLGSDQKDEIKAAQKSIEECKMGKKLVAEPVRVFIDNIGPSVNSSFMDYSPLISTDESMMIFTSKRGKPGDPQAGEGFYFENIYVSYSEDDGKTWSEAVSMEKPISIKGENNATVGLSPDGQQLFVFNQENGGDILISELKGSEWSKPDDKVTKKYINSQMHESSASFSFDGRTMYFDSNKDASEKELNNPELSFVDIPHNIYFTQWDDKKERWGEPENLSNSINSEYDERGVFMHPDGRTIYFSSRGHSTMGGFDIFKSELQDDNTWSEPENLGYPINTTGDDIFFVMAASGKHGYYASAIDGGEGSYDIYRITFRGPEKPITQSNEDNLLASTEPESEVVMGEAVEVKTMRLTILKGTVKDAMTLEPLEATIEIVDNELNQVISVMKSNSATGKFLVSLPSGKNYGIAVKAPDYLFHSENFNIPEATNYQEVTKDILLGKMAVGVKIVLKNIFFDYAKATLRSESNAELDRLTKLLTDYPTTKIEISGHTDSKGTAEGNQKLSQRRAESVVSYLISKGIDKGRLTAKGYGEEEPIDTNDTDAGRQNNRRVEFKVLEN